MYTYNPFTSPNTISLLEVQLKGNDYGKLQTYLLDNAPEFIALSYTWGCPYSNPNYELEDSADTAALNSQYTANRTIPITVDGAILMVSGNCKDAIDNIKERYNSGNFHIWIDAVCINQEDLDERAAQVSIMGHIYSKAFRVIIWLGNSLYNTKRALELIDAISQIPDEHLAANETAYTIALENIRNRQHHHKAQRLENPCFVFGKNLVPTCLDSSRICFATIHNSPLWNQQNSVAKHLENFQYILGHRMAPCLTQIGVSCSCGHRRGEICSSHAVNLCS
jgi:hypothetical protein